MANIRLTGLVKAVMVYSRTTAAPLHLEKTTGLSQVLQINPLPTGLKKQKSLHVQGINA